VSKKLAQRDNVESFLQKSIEAGGGYTIEENAAANMRQARQRSMTAHEKAFDNIAETMRDLESEQRRPYKRKAYLHNPARQPTLGYRRWRPPRFNRPQRFEAKFGTVDYMDANTRNRYRDPVIGQGLMRRHRFLQQPYHLRGGYRGQQLPSARARRVQQRMVHTRARPRPEEYETIANIPGQSHAFRHVFTDMARRNPATSYKKRK